MSLYHSTDHVFSYPLWHRQTTVTSSMKIAIVRPQVCFLARRHSVLRTPHKAPTSYNGSLVNAKS